MDSQGKENRESNIILHNVLESSSQDPVVRKQHDANIFGKVATALLGSNVRVETAQIFRLGKKQGMQEHGTIAEN